MTRHSIPMNSSHNAWSTRIYTEISTIKREQQTSLSMDQWPCPELGYRAVGGRRIFCLSVSESLPAVKRSIGFTRLSLYVCMCWI